MAPTTDPNRFKFRVARLSKSARFLFTMTGMVVLILVFSVAGAFAQGQPGAIDPTFTGGADNAVNSIAFQSDGRILIGGNFTAVNGVARNRIARLNPDGTLDPTVDVGVSIDNRVQALAIQPDGNIVVVGDFSNRVIRLKPDGSLDPTFATVQTDGAVRSLALQPDGKIIVGGSFGTIQGVSQIGIARLNADGSYDASFGNSLNFATPILTIALQPDGKLLIGGDFFPSILRLNPNGGLDSTFNPTTDGFIFAISLQPDGKIILGGGFLEVNGSPRRHIARLNPDGSLDGFASTGMGITGGTSARVTALLIQPDGSVIIGGLFNAVDGVPRGNIARLNPDGSLETTFGNGLSGTTTVLSSFALQANGRLLVGGAFSTLNGSPANRLVGLYTDPCARSSALDAPAAGLNGSFSVTSTDPSCAWTATSDAPWITITGGASGTGDGSISYTVAPNPGPGRFGTITAAGHTFVINQAGTGPAVFPPFAPPALFPSSISPGSHDTSFSPAANGRVQSLRLQSDGRIVIAGGFTTVNGQPRNRVARLNADGSLDPAFIPPAFTGGGILSAAVQPDGKVLIGGTFTEPGSRIVRLNVDGTVDTTFTTAMNRSVNAIEVLPNGKILVGGGFSLVNGTPRGAIVRLNPDGTIDSTFVGTTDEFVEVIHIQSDGRILIGGRFFNVNGITQPYLARLNLDGTLDTTFLYASTVGDADLYGVISIATQPDGRILIGGDFTTGNSAIGRNGIARLNADGTLDTTFGAGQSGLTRISQPAFNARIQEITLQPDGKILAAGTFNVINGLARPGIARLNADGTTDTTFHFGKAGCNNDAWSMTLQPDGRILIGGDFSNYNGGPALRLARIYSSTCAQTVAIDTPAAGSTGGFSVTSTDAGCAWTATSNVAWLTVASGANGIGNGTVNYTVAPNSGPRRTGVINVAGREYRVTQAAGTPVNVNSAVSLAITSVAPAPPTCGAQGYSNDLVLTANLVNTSTTTLSSLSFVVTELRETGGVPPAIPFRLISADGATCDSGGLVGAVQSLPPSLTLAPGQSTPVTFRIAAPSLRRFRFLLNVFGISSDGVGEMRKIRQQRTVGPFEVVFEPGLKTVPTELAFAQTTTRPNRGNALR